MARIEDWDDANWKWIKLGDHLGAAGWSQHDPRKLKRQLQAGRAIILETTERNSSDRTIYAYAVEWKKVPLEGAIQIWIASERADAVSRDQLLNHLP